MTSLMWASLLLSMACVLHSPCMGQVEESVPDMRGLMSLLAAPATPRALAATRRQTATFDRDDSMIPTTRSGTMVSSTDGAQVSTPFTDEVVVSALPNSRNAFRERTTRAGDLVRDAEGRVRSDVSRLSESSEDLVTEAGGSLRSDIARLSESSAGRDTILREILTTMPEDMKLNIMTMLMDSINTQANDYSEYLPINMESGNMDTGPMDNMNTGGRPVDNDNMGGASMDNVNVEGESMNMMNMAPGPMDMNMEPGTMDMNMQEGPMDVNMQPVPMDNNMQPEPTDNNMQPGPMDMNMQPGPMDMNMQPGPMDMNMAPRPPPRPPMGTPPGNILLDNGYVILRNYRYGARREPYAESTEDDQTIRRFGPRYNDFGNFAFGRFAVEYES